MRTAHSMQRRRDRRGVALILVLLLTVALASLALSAIYLASSAGILSRSYQREQDFRYAAEAALAMGKSRLNNDAYALPATGDTTLVSNGVVRSADGQVLPGVRVNVYAGPTGSSTGQFGRFASVVAEAHDASGARYVRRLELAQESFAKFAYWTDRETNGSQVIYFNNGDRLVGPVWSNDEIHIGSGGAQFNDEVGTAKTISGKQYGTFLKGYQEHAKRIELPDNDVLDKLQGYASSGGFVFNAPTNGSDASVAMMRIEFLPIDIDGDGAGTADNEGFFRVYRAKNQSGAAAWLRGDYTQENCGDWHWSRKDGTWEFYPIAVHEQTWFRDSLTNTPGEVNDYDSNIRSSDFRAMMGTILGGSRPGRPAPRCYPGGDPHLVAIERAGTSAGKRGGTDTTFTASGAKGAWLSWSGPWQGTVPTQISSRPDAGYLFPLFRGYNPGTQGVIFVNGTVGVSGVVRGNVTLYAKNGTIVFLDDLTYSTQSNPAAQICPDMLGLIAGKNAVVADNAINTPQDANAFREKSMDDTEGVDIQGVIMALSQSFTVEDYDRGPTAALQCGAGNWSGRGCLTLTGGVIQEARGPVGLSSGEGFIKRYTYDRCALQNPPPFFPTTGRFIDNRYYELDPARFDVTQLFEQLAPRK